MPLPPATDAAAVRPRLAASAPRDDQAVLVGVDLCLDPILQKLAVRDRIQAVIYAYEHGLVVPGR